MRMGAGRRAADSCPVCSAEMGISIEEQARALLQAVILGGVLDLLFWAAVTAALFIHAVTAQGGEVRIYMVLAVFAGAGLYFFFLSRGVLKIGYLIADFLGVLWHMATLPARGVFALCKKIGKKQKSRVKCSKNKTKLRAGQDAFQS